MRCLRNTAFGALALITLAMTAATAIEKLGGTAMAMRLIYHSPLATALWAIIALTGAAYVVRRRRAMPTAAILLHFSFITVLSGAAVTFFLGEHGSVKLYAGGAPAGSFTLSDGGKADFPFSVRLVDCDIKYYPGTSSAMDYRSTLLIGRPGQPDVTGETAMNKVLSIDNYRFYQTSIGPDYSVLTVAHDPAGITLTYIGYGLFVISFILFFFSSHSRFRQLLRRVAVLLAAALPLTISAAGNGTPEPQSLQRPLAANFGMLYAYWNGRVTPVQTVARDFCIKIHGRDSYRGLSAEQVLTGWLFYYDDWKHEPFIRVKSAGIKKLLGNDSGYASLADFYRNGRYILTAGENDAPIDRDLAELDDKIGLLTQMCTGRGLKIFPFRADSAGNTAATQWLSWVDAPPAAMPTEERAFISTSMEGLAREIAHRRFNNANELLSIIRDRQLHSAGKENLPSGLRLEAERLYNRTSSPWMRTAAAGCCALLTFLIGRKRRPAALAASLAALACVSWFLALQWITGGHLPMSNGHETMQTMAWIACAAACAFSRRLPELCGGALLVATLALTVAAMGESNPAVTPLQPVLASPFLSVHVMLVMTSYAIFAIMMLNSLLALTVRRSECERLAALSTVLLYPAVFALGAGIFTGAVWANQSWGRYWGWDPKETWALVTLIIYALPLHSGSFAWFRNARRVNAYYLFAFISVLMTYFGVNFLLNGLHSYATS